jgi:hypothetical protein
MIKFCGYCGFRFVRADHLAVYCSRCARATFFESDNEDRVYGPLNWPLDLVFLREFYNLIRTDKPLTVDDLMKLEIPEDYEHYTMLWSI